MSNQIEAERFVKAWAPTESDWVNHDLSVKAHEAGQDFGAQVEREKILKVAEGIADHGNYGGAETQGVEWFLRELKQQLSEGNNDD